MSGQPWRADAGWQHGHSPNDFLYTLRVTFEPPAAAENVLARVGARPHVLGGGVAYSHQAGDFTLTSAGQDAVDALEDGAAAVAKLAAEEGAIARFEQLPPTDVVTNEDAVRIDGYWIPRSASASYAQRRDRIVAALGQAAGRLGFAATLAQEDGMTVLQLGRGLGEEPSASLLLGDMQLSIFEADEADGRLDQTVAETMTDD